MAEFKFSCSHCDQHLQCDESLSGRQIQCPHCNTLIRIPPAPGKTAAYQPESGKTWGTFVGGQIEPPKGIAIKHPNDLPRPECPE
jgi:DNA-directed RNA polymerase subunit RPC12/RpoP